MCRRKRGSMSRKRFFICLAVLSGWIVFIFCHSLQPGEVSTSESQWALDLLQRVFPFPLSMYMVRKLGHFVEFAILGVLAGLLFGGRCKRLPAGLLFAAMTGVITALCDETIQLFVAGRTGRIQDVWIDIAGAFTGAVLVLARQLLIRKEK